MNQCTELVGPLRDRFTLEQRLVAICDELSELNDMQEISPREKLRILQLRDDEAATAAALRAGGGL